MIKTDKYKKGVIALTQKAAELNPLLGVYEMHYLNKDARFIVQLTNGKLEIEIELARECEENPDQLQYGKIRKVVFPYGEEEDEAGHRRHDSPVNTAWRRLFAKQTKF